MSVLMADAERNDGWLIDAAGHRQIFVPAGIEFDLDVDVTVF